MLLVNRSGFRSAWHWAVLVVSAAACCGALAQGVTSSTILIGQSAPMSGSNKDLGQEIRNGALAYFKKVNDAGGINGRKLELLTLDDANDVKRAGENTKSLIEEKNVLALFGYASATLSRPALPFVEQNKVPFVGPFTGADPMRKFNRYVYNIRASYADELEKIVEHYASTGSTRFAIVHYDDVVGKENFTAVDTALKKRGLTAVSVAAFKDRAKPDIEAGVRSVITGNPDVVILTTLYKATSDFIKAARKSGLNAQFISNSFPGAGPLAKELGTEGVGVAITQVVPPFGRTSVPIVVEYRVATEKLLGKKEYSFTSLEGYIAAKALGEAIKRAGQKLTRDSLLQALDSLRDYDVGGYFVNFGANNHNGSSYVELTIIAKDGRFVF